MKNFTNYYDLKEHLLNDLNLQSYGFDQAFSDFENKTMATGAISQLDDICIVGNFNWLDNEENEINISIHFCVDENEESFYIVE